MSVSLERKVSRWPGALVLVGLCGVGAAALAYFTSPSGLLPPHAGSGPSDARPPIRVPMFVDPVTVRPTPRFRFTFDPPEALAELRAQEHLDQVVADQAGDLERAVALMRWVRAQWEPGIPSPYPPINARVILADIRRKFTGGFYAQYNYVLAQGLQSFGIPARYVSLKDHEVIEARLPDRGGWICFDPLYATWYKDESDRPLSVLQIHERQREGKPVLLADPHLVPDAAAHLKSFAWFAVWLKNDHMTAPVNFTDLERYKVYFLDDLAGARRLPPGSLSTSEAADLYPD
ncbi:MAG: hypothetical protein ACREAA_11545 [Candidatus Polarisedimenticolia bacterium]